LEIKNQGGIRSLNYADKEAIWEAIKKVLERTLDQQFPRLLDRYEARKREISESRRHIKAKPVPLTSKTVAEAAKDYRLQRLNDDGSYWIKVAKRKEKERKEREAREKAALVLPEETKQKIVNAAKTNPFKKPLAFNRPSKVG
jgi:hypothetical protein